MATEPAATLATLLLEIEDPYEALEAIRPILVETAFVDVCDAMEICPVHFCDAQICRDDEEDCPCGCGEAYTPPSSESEA